MKKRAFRRAAVTLCAVVTALSSVLQGAALSVAERTYSPEDAVRVIVELEDEPLLGSEEACTMGISYLDTDEAKQRADEIDKDMDKALGYIRRLYPEAETEGRFDTLMCGFSTYLPKDLWDDAEQCGLIKSISPAFDMEADMTEALYQGEVMDFYDETGCRGEGEVIAVIDSELFRNHEMFAPLDADIDVKLTKRDIERAVEERSLSRKIDPDKAYCSSKVPFAVNYTGEDMYRTESEELYHGTHVAGIAAGNRVYDEQTGMTIQGVAPEAQILFFGIFLYQKEEKKVIAPVDAVIAAMEDAVKLDADVINLSLGTRDPGAQSNGLYDEIMNITEKLGIVVCCAAGNDSSDIGSPDSPDTGTINEPARIGSAFSVASCDASVGTENFFTLDGGSKISYTQCCDVQTDNAFVNVPTEYVYCDDPEDIGDAEGKIVLFDMKERNVDELAQQAKAAGAVGMILCCDEGYSETMNTDKLPACIIRSRSGEIMKTAPTKILTFSGETVKVPAPTKISQFSSRGTTASLEIKPEICGVGRSLTSASYDGTNGYRSLHGTSMAAPYVSGCCALADQYIDSLGIDMKSDVRIQYIKNLLMNSAVPVMNGDNFESPRAQGAGLADMKNMYMDKVILTSDQNKAKIELGDDLGYGFSFKVCARNLSNEDVSFDTAELRLTTDDVYVDNDKVTISDVLALPAEVTIPGELKSIAAGEQKTVTVDVELDETKADEIAQWFRNGFFAEGFLMMSGADNCCDISIPVMGYVGDWDMVPIFSEDSVKAGNDSLDNYMLTNFGSYTIPASLSLAAMVEARDMLYDENGSLEKYKQAVYDASHRDYVVSRNRDYIGDDIAYRAYPKRNVQLAQLKLTDRDGNIYEADMGEKLWRKNAHEDIYYFGKEELPEGIYKGEISGHILREGSEDKLQTMSFDFTIDNTAPEISEVNVTEKDGRKILTLTAQDDNLDGLFVYGVKKDGARSPKDLNALNDVLGLFTLIEQTSDGISPTACTSLSEFVTERMLTEEDVPAYCDYLDVIAAHPDESGKETFSYDVTDLEEYTVTVADRGYNSVNYSPGLPIVGKLNAPVAAKRGSKLALKAPGIKSEVPVTEQGWEISFDTYKWEKFDPETPMSARYHNMYLRYYACSGEKRSASNHVRISMEGVPIMKVTLISNGAVITETITDSCVYDPSFFGYGKYRIKVSADGYVTREYSVDVRDDRDHSIVMELSRKGDINCDGEINVTDIAVCAAHIRGVRALESYPQALADANGDGEINVTDIAVIAAHLKGLKPIS